MKKVNLIVLLFTLVLSLTGCIQQDVETTEEPYTLTFDFFDNYVYSLDDGSYINDANFATSNRQRIYSTSITVSDYTKISYMLFWGESNDYIGYYTLDGIDDTKDGYLGNVSSNVVTFPTGTDKISVQVNKTGEDGYYKYNSESYLSYTYTEITVRDDDYVIESIDDYISVVDGYETLTYRDIFGDPTRFGGANNIISNGDFETNISGWSCEAWAYVACQWDSNEYIHMYADSGTANPTIAVLQVLSIDVDVEYYYNYDIYIGTSLTDLESRLSFIYGSSYNVVDDVTPNVWNNIKGFTDPVTEDNGYLRFYIYGEASFPQNDYVYMDNIYLYDFDEMFDGYTEPSTSDFEDMIDEYERLNQFGDGEITLLDLTTTLGTIENGLYDSGNWGNTLDAFDNEGVDYYNFENEQVNGAFNTSGLTGMGLSPNGGDTTLTNNNNMLEVQDDTPSGATGFGISWVNLASLDGYNIYYSFDVKPAITYTPDLYNAGVYYATGETATADVFTTANASLLFNKSGSLVTYIFDGVGSTEIVYIDNLNIFNLHTNEYWLNQNPNQAYNPSFTDDTNSDGIADNWATSLMENESVFGGQQYAEPDSSTGYHSLYYTTEDDYTIGDFITASITIEDVNSGYVSLVLKQKNADASWTDLADTGTLSVSNGDVLTIEGETTDKFSTAKLQLHIYVHNDLGDKVYSGSVEDITIDHMEWRNIGDKSFTATKTFIDDVLDEYNYIDGSMYVPDPNDTDLDGNFDFADVTNGLSFGESIMYYNQDDIGTILPTAIYSWGQTDITTWLSIYYDDDWNLTTNYSYGDNYDTLDVLNPIAFSAIFEYSDMLEENTERDYIIDLYYDYKNNVDRWEWFTEFGVTSEIYNDGFYDEWNIQNTPENTNTLSTLQTVSYSGTRTVNDYTKSDIDDTINDSLDSIGAEGLNGDIVSITIMFAIILLTIGALIIAKAQMSLIAMAITMELFIFTVLGWVSGWVWLVIGASLLLILYFIFSKKGGATE